MIGLRQGTVRLEEYTSEWREYYQREKRLLATTLGDNLLGIEHIGSTSIVGMTAKPIIDMMVGVRSLEKGKELVVSLEQLGYKYISEANLPGRLFFSKGKGDIREVHLHMVEWKGQYWREHILFRDYLRKNKELAQDYQRLKRELHDKFKHDRDAYTSSKGDFIKSVLEEAKRSM